LGLVDGLVDSGTNFVRLAFIKAFIENVSAIKATKAVIAGNDLTMLGGLNGGKLS